MKRRCPDPIQTQRYVDPAACELRRDHRLVVVHRDIAVEVAAADLYVRPEETRFLEMLADTLELDKLTTAAIERGIRARNTVI